MKAKPALLVLLGAACALTDRGPVAAVELTLSSLSLSEDSLELETAVSAEVEVSAIAISGDPIASAPFSVSSSDASIVQVTLGAPMAIAITSVGTGDAVVTVSSGGKSAAVAVRVIPRVAEIDMVEQTILLPPGGTRQVSFVLRDASGAELQRPTTWTTLDPAVVTVSNTGLLTAGSVAGRTAVYVGRSGVPSKVLIVTRAAPAGIASVATSFRGSCVIATDAARYCWGGTEISNSWTSRVRQLEPVIVESNLALVNISGWNTLCGLTATGSAYCWGNTAYGSLGDGTSGFLNVPAEASRAVSGGRSFASIEVGYSHVCGLDADGVAYCWGRNDEGALGDGSATLYPINNDRALPTAVATAERFTQLALGAVHTCGLAMDGRVLCWGSTSQLGVTGLSTAHTPVDVSRGRRYRFVAAGPEMTCAITSDDETYCWGRFPEFYEPRLLESPVPFSSIVIGQGGQSAEAVGFACGLTATGAAYCWGANDYGQLGDGTNTSRATPVAVAGGHLFRMISAGSRHVCAVTLADAVYCWGANSFGQLGTGTSDVASTVPVRPVWP